MPPLGGFWWQEGARSADYSHKEDFDWISLIRLPDFATEQEVEWAKAEAASKKGGDFSEVEFLRVKGQNVCLARRVAGVRFGLFECRLSGCSRCR